MISRDAHRQRLRQARREVTAYRGDTRRIVLDISGLRHREVGRILLGNWALQIGALARYTIMLAMAVCPFNALKIWVYRLLGFRIGDNVYIAPLVYLDITRPDLIRIGNNVIIGIGSAIAVHERSMEYLALGRVIIQDGVTIGGRCLIRHGVTIRRGAAVETDACVKHDVNGASQNG